MSNESAPQVSADALAAPSPTEPRSKLAVISGVVQFLAAIPLIVMMVHITANAISRRYFGHPLHNTLELTQYWYLPIIVAFGFVLAVNTGEHTDAPLFYQYFSRSGKLLATLLSAVLTVVTLLAFAWYSLQAALDDKEIERTGGVSGLTIWPVTFAMPIAFACMSVLFAFYFVRYIRNGFEHEEAETDHLEQA